MKKLTSIFSEVQNQKAKYSNPEFSRGCFKKFYPNILAFTKSKSKVYAEDITQETFTRFFEALSKGKKMKFKQDEDILKYLITISKNILNNHFKERGRQFFQFEENWDNLNDSQISNPIKQLDQQDEILFIRKQLPSQQREILDLIAQGFSYQEIAEQLNLKIGTVRKYAFRGRSKLKRLFNSLIVKTTRRS